MDPRHPQWGDLPPSQEIPLRDLSRTPDGRTGTSSWTNRPSEGSGRERRLVGERAGLSGRTHSARYENVLNQAFNEDTNNDRLRPPHEVPAREARQRPAADDDEGELSPLNLGDFSSASIGMVPFDSSSRDTSAAGRATQPSHAYEDDRSYRDFPSTAHGPEHAFPSDDNIPLTDPEYTQPISGSPLPPAPSPSHRRQRSRVFGDRMLGHDLEGGTSTTRRAHSPTRSRSISDAATPFLEAGELLRKMSQRVVNLSNEPEIAENNTQRRASDRGATLDAPPSFPAMMDYAHDEPNSVPFSPPNEKDRAYLDRRRQRYLRDPNPLKGRSLGLFSPGSRVRRWLCEILVHPVTEPLILVLIVMQTIILAGEAAPYLQLGQPRPSWTQSVWGWILVALFVVYTCEIIAKIIVSGFIRNAYEYSTLPHGVTLWQKLNENVRAFFGSTRAPSHRIVGADHGEFQPSIVRSFTALQDQADVRGNSRQAQRLRLARRAFLRHSFNRIDFAALIAFWIAIILSLTNIASAKHIYVFQMISCLRITRLLSLTSGTSVILRSLKKAAPSLLNVAFLISFFWLLFAIVGIQSFKSSLQRTCLFLGDNATKFDSGGLDDGVLEKIIAGGYDLNNTFGGNTQFCGGSLHPNGNKSAIPYFTSDLQLYKGDPKGYLCPTGSICLQQANPYNNSVSFDNIGQSLQLVFVVMSSNTFTDVLYYTTQTDSLAGALFFIFGIVIMSFWLINLLIAVITSSFQIIREESKASAFGADEQPNPIDNNVRQHRRSRMMKWFSKTYWFWVILIVFDLVVQGFRTSSAPQSAITFINVTETVVTLLLLVEIIIRFAIDWRYFHRSKRNWFDLFLAISTSIIQLPSIHGSLAYPALTVFQILRVYRVVYAVPFVRNLVITVLGNVSGIVNLIVFVFLVTLFAAIFAVQLLRGEIPQWDTFQNFVRIPFTNTFNSFLGMYQILSSENWTAVMYAATAFEEIWSTSWISAIFFILWFIFGNFIIISMFIAVIQENFDVSEDEKRLHQVRAFLQQKELTGSTHSNLSLAAIFRFGRNKSRLQDPVDFGPATIEMFKDTVVQDFLDAQMEAMDDPNAGADTQSITSRNSSQTSTLNRLWVRVQRAVLGAEPNPFYSDLMFSRPYEELDPRSMAQEIASAAEKRKKAQRQYLVDHPKYNVSLYIFRPKDPIRKLCQSFVGPGRGSKRFEGVDPVKMRWYTFSIFIYACIIAMVVLACIATPLNQREYFMVQTVDISRNWFLWTDLVFAAIFTVEAIIKIIADGFFFTPNAYLRGAWGMIDCTVLITLWISVVASLLDSQNVARIIGAFKALRALRLLNVSDSARDTFHSIIVRGALKLLSAAFVSLALLIPFAIYGVNLFNGRLHQCNDTNPVPWNQSITSLSQCVGEYQASPFLWTFWAPRQVSNPYFNFDSFGESLFILFQIVSQEGWIDVMWAAISAKQIGQQPVPNNNPANGLFFVVFNLLGTVFILTLFVSIFMRSYTEQTGVAFLTSDQRSWLELRKLLRQISPSKRPSNLPRSSWVNWCYRRAVRKNGIWQRIITVVLIFHVILLASESNPESPPWEITKNILFAVFVVLYIANIVIRIIGLTWKRFRRSSWDLYALIIVSGTVVLTILNFFFSNTQSTVRQLQKLFLAFISLLLIPRNNQLDQLFKTAAASLSAIANLLLTWFVLYIVFAIAMTQTLGLTRFGSTGQANLNFRTVPKALILLFRMSCGESWNQIMIDFANAVSPNCFVGPTFLTSDCGSEGWAKFLFISWNIISMYIFTSMFVSLIYESFSYVYQRSSALSILNREEIRRFKQAWATFDPDGTGFIPKDSFPRLLGELSGIFSMRIYEGDHSVHQILDDCRIDPRNMSSQEGVIEGVDLYRLNQKLRTIDVQEIRRRRLRLMVFSQEILVSADPDRGVSFQSVLLILAHYNVINDSKSLRLEEFLRRRYRLQRVEEEVQRRIVIGFFDTLFWSRRFRRRRELRESARMVDIPQFEVPEILVDDQDGSEERKASHKMKAEPSSRPPKISIQPVDTSFETPEIFIDDQVSPTTTRTRRGRGWTIEPSESRSDTPQPSLFARVDGPSDWAMNPYSFGNEAEDDRTDRRGSETSTGRSPGFLSPNEAPTTRHRRQQSSINSQRTLSPLEAFDNSAWGESIRRSFTMTRRQGTQGNRSVSPEH